MKYITIATAITIVSVTIMSTWAQGKQTELQQSRDGGTYQQKLEQAIGQKL